MSDQIKHGTIVKNLAGTIAQVEYLDHTFDLQDEPVTLARCRDVDWGTTFITRVEMLHVLSLEEIKASKVLLTLAKKRRCAA